MEAAHARRWLPETVIGLLAPAVFAYRVGRPSPWYDEAITREVTSRPAGEIVDLVGHVDLVHATYYLMVHALLGPSATVTPIRLISVVAAALTAVLLVRLGRQLGSARVGTLAALFFVVAPFASRYAQEARPYALVACAATASTLALVRVCRKPWRPGRWVAYAATIVVIGLLNILALLMIAVHLTYVLGSSSRAVRRRWYAAAGGGLLLIAPLVIASTRQREQVAWLPRPTVDALTGFFHAQYHHGSWVAVALVVLAIAGLGRGTHAPALGLGLAWALLPPVLLWALSQAHPLFDWRYVFFTMPGTALALASLATLVRFRLALVGVTVLALLGLHMQTVYRYRASGHAEDLRGAAEAVAHGAQPGDAVLFLPSTRRVVEAAYPAAFAGVDDVALARTGEQSTTLLGTEEPVSVIADELKHRYRVWVVTGAARFGEDPTKSELAKERLIYDHYRLVGIPLSGRYEVRLYQRSHGSVTSPGITAGSSSAR